MRRLKLCTRHCVMFVFALCLDEVGLATRSAFAQSRQGPSTVEGFEVASVKECASDGAAPASSPGRLSLNCWSLKRLIQDAYDVFASGSVDPLNPLFPSLGLEGGPDWMKSARYTISAKTTKPQSVAAMRGPLMQKLLEERFHLRVHRQTREVPAYIMSVAKGGPKLHATEKGSCNDMVTTDGSHSMRDRPGGKPWCVIIPPSREGTKWVRDVKGMSMDVLAHILRWDRPVINRTGLTGTYDIRLEWWEGEPSDSGGDSRDRARDATIASLMSVMAKQLGLRFEAGVGPREFLVIDRLERPSKD